MARRPRLLLATIIAFALLTGVLPVAPMANVAAASCVRLSGGNFDAAGNDNYAAHLNGEYVRIHNACSSAKSLSGWRLHDYGRKHTFAFPSGFKLGAGRTVTVYSGKGTRSSSKLYWGRTYGAVWNNTPPERAYLRNSAGTLVSSWSEY